ncbi:MAG: acyltransferase [Bacteroidota bacterium]
MNNLNSSVYIKNLDLFRFIAAFMIVIHHSYLGWIGWWGYPGFMSSGTYSTLSGFGFYMNRFIENFGFGVDMFFMISGFLITYLLMKEKISFGKIDFKKFYIRRILRIWPLYYLAIAVAPFIVNWLGNPQPDYIPNLLFYNNFHAIHTEQWTYPFAHFWSICIEEHFYVAWPLIIAFVPNKRLPATFGLLITLSIAFRAYTMLTDPEPNWVLYLNTFSRMDALVLGAIFGYLHSIKPIRIHVHGSIRLLLYLIFLTLFATDVVVDCRNIYAVCFKNYIYLLIAGFAMLNYLFNPDAKLLVRKKNIFHYFGKISYGIYIYHNILLSIVIKKIMLTYDISNIYVFFGLMFSLSVIIPVISFELYEKWFLKLKSRFEIIRTSEKQNSKKSKDF